MAQNMYCDNHKSTNKKYRKGYDNIKWNEDDKGSNDKKNNTKSYENYINTANI